MELFEKTLSSDEIYKGKIITLRRDEVLLQNGRTAFREVVDHPGGVAVLALDEEEQALFVRQFRYPYGEVLLELPAGKLERGEDPAACGRRELEEETGCAAADFRFLGRLYPSPGCYGEVLYLYLARGLTRTAQKLDADEFLRVLRLPFAEALEKCLSGEIVDAKTMLAILKYSELRRRGEG